MLRLLSEKSFHVPFQMKSDNNATVNHQSVSSFQRVFV